MKSERLKKLESELNDLQHWMNLGLVPKSDSDKHELEIEGVKHKIEEEKQRLNYLKESGEVDEYTAPKRSTGKPQYEPQSMPDLMGSEDQNEFGSSSSSSSSSRNDTFEADVSSLFDIEAGTEERDHTTAESDDEDQFSDKKRWGRFARDRGMILDPDADNW